MLNRYLFVVVFALAVPACASEVRVWGESPFGVDFATINSFYSGIAGVNSQIIGGQLNTNDLTGVNLLWAIQPADAYTADEITSMANLLAGGGRIAFMGEHGGIASNENNRINAALLALGATMSIQSTTVHDSGFRNASVGDGQILSHTLTNGVNVYRYAAYAPITASGTAQVLMIGENQPSNMMVYQNIGPGSIFLITDQNVWDTGVVADTAGNDNHQMFENLLLGDTFNGQVPEPSSMVLLLSGSVAVLALRRRRQQ